MDDVEQTPLQNMLRSVQLSIKKLLLTCVGVYPVVRFYHQVAFLTGICRGRPWFWWQPRSQVYCQSCWIETLWFPLKDENTKNGNTFLWLNCVNSNRMSSLRRNLFLTLPRIHSDSLQNKPESPPAWTQEAYRPQRIKYSICYPRWGTSPRPGLTGGGYPRWGTPSQVWWGWGLPEVGYPLGRGTPSQVRQGVPKVGYPPARSDGGVPEVGYPLAGVPPSQVWWGGTWGGVPPGRGTPQPGLTGGVPKVGYPPAGPGWGTPHLDLARVSPPPQGVDRLKTLPSLILRMRSVITWNTTGKLCFKYVPFSDKLDQTPLNAAKYEADFLTSLQLNSPAFKK